MENFMISYEMHCYGHIIRDRSAGGAVSTSVSFCSGCRQRPISKDFKKNSGSCERGRGVHSYASATASFSSSASFSTSARAAALNTAVLGSVSRARS